MGRFPGTCFLPESCPDAWLLTAVIPTCRNRPSFSTPPTADESIPGSRRHPVAFGCLYAGLRKRFRSLLKLWAFCQIPGSRPFSVFCAQCMPEGRAADHFHIFSAVSEGLSSRAGPAAQSIGLCRTFGRRERVHAGCPSACAGTCFWQAGAVRRLSQPSALKHCSSFS